MSRVGLFKSDKKREWEKWEKEFRKKENFDTRVGRTMYPLPRPVNIF